MENSEAQQSPFAINKKGSGESYELTPNSNKTVQPVALLRLSVFYSCVAKGKGKTRFSD
ncbi:RepFIB replication protein A [Leclercia adecarboxylata]|uniref:RepFIB replication protein A n=1 Tax=Leclercia adecarboxylata TaxID=83655 RepID=A0A4U9HXH0_9ENTR|nr:RepFIB replication protein A [Leclercia adecarboxylata]